MTIFRAISMEINSVCFGNCRNHISAILWQFAV